MRILTLSTIALATALSAGVASAQSVNPGVAQLAAEAGVPAGALSTNDLYRLIEAQRSNDDATVRFLLDRVAGSTNVSTMGANVSNDVQLARSAGVAPGLYSASDLIDIEEARREGDTSALNILLSGAKYSPETARSDAGKAQLAASLGVNAADYSLAELTVLRAEMEAIRNDG